MQKLSKCVICGAEFPAAIVWSVTQPRDKSEPKPFPKEICDDCAGAGVSHRSHHAVRHHNTGSIRPYIDLAGEIEHLVMDEYYNAYRDAIESAYTVQFDMGITDDEAAFIALHRRITSGGEQAYHNALTLGNLDSLLESMRRSVEQSSEPLRRMVKDGYNIFRRYERYKAWKQAQKEAGERQAQRAREALLRRRNKKST